MKERSAAPRDELRWRTGSSAQHEERSRDNEERGEDRPNKDEEPAGVLPSPGTRCAEHTWGCETYPQTTEGDSVEQQTQYVGIDLHRRRSVIVRRNQAGETLDTVRIDNDPVVLAAELAKAGEHPEVISKPPMAGTGRPM